jgi:C4-dicarboxylate-specific signal transduction histidine kinase
MLQEHAKELTYVLKLVKQNKQAIAELANRVAVITRDVRATLRGKEQYVDESLRLALEQINK